MINHVLIVSQSNRCVKGSHVSMTQRWREMNRDAHFLIVVLTSSIRWSIYLLL